MLLLLALMSRLLGDYKMIVARSVTVQEGLCILVPCSFSYPEDSQNFYPVYGYWFKDPTNTESGDPVATNNPAKDLLRSTEGRFRLEGDPRKRNCALLIRDAQRRDQGPYFFRVEKGMAVRYSFKESKFWLTVTDLTQKPDVFIPETLVARQPVTVLCVFNWTSAQCPAPAFSWAGSALDSQGIRVPGAPYSMLRLTPGPQDHDSELTCRADFRNGLSTQRTVRLSVTYSPQHPVISISQDNGAAQEIQENIPRVEVQKDQLVLLLCAADSRPPATLTWELGGRLLSQSLPSEHSPLRLELPRVKPEDAGRYTCRAESSLGSKQHTLDLSVQYPPQDLSVMVSQANSTVLEILGNGTSLPVLEGQSLRLVCVAHSKPPARLSWARGTQALSPSWMTTPGVLELPRVQLEHEGEVTCHAENQLGAHSVSLCLSVHYETAGSTAFSTAFSKGVLVGGSSMALLSLCLALLLLKVRRATHTQADTREPKFSRSSTILDYINVVPRAGPLARNRKAKPSSPSQTLSPETHSPRPKKNQSEQPVVFLGSPEPKTYMGPPDSEISPDGLHYATVNFSGHRPWDTQPPKGTQEDYAEIKFYRRSSEL